LAKDMGQKIASHCGVKSEANEFGQQQFSPTRENSQNLFQWVNILEAQKCRNSLAKISDSSKPADYF